MTIGEALAGARGQIVWIVALTVSTAAIIYLEQLDVGAPVRAALTDSSSQAAVSSTSAARRALVQAEARMTLAPEDPDAAASLLLALTVAVQSGALAIGDGRSRAEAIESKAKAAGPEWQPVALLVDLTFGN